MASAWVRPPRLNRKVSGATSSSIEPEAASRESCTSAPTERRRLRPSEPVSRRASSPPAASPNCRCLTAPQFSRRRSRRRPTAGSTPASTSPSAPACSNAPRSTARSASSAIGASTRSRSQDVAAMVAAVTDAGAKPSYVRKVLQSDRDDVRPRRHHPNPARDKTIVKLPRETAARRSTRRPPSTCSPSTSCSRRATGCRCSCSTRPGCGSASSRR